MFQSTVFFPVNHVPFFSWKVSVFFSRLAICDRSHNIFLSSIRNLSLRSTALQRTVLKRRHHVCCTLVYRSLILTSVLSSYIKCIDRRSIRIGIKLRALPKRFGLQSAAVGSACDGGSASIEVCDGATSAEQHEEHGVERKAAHSRAENRSL